MLECQTHKWGLAAEHSRPFQRTARWKGDSGAGPHLASGCASWAKHGCPAPAAAVQRASAAPSAQPPLLKSRKLPACSPGVAAVPEQSRDSRQVRCQRRAAPHADARRTWAAGAVLAPQPSAFWQVPPEIAVQRVAQTMPPRLAESASSAAGSGMVQTRRKSAAAAAGPGGSGGEPEPFQVGFAISTWQNSGDQSKEASNWGIFERQRTWLGMSTIDNGDRCGESSDFWNRYESLPRAASTRRRCSGTATCLSACAGARRVTCIAAGSQRCAPGCPASAACVAARLTARASVCLPCIHRPPREPAVCLSAVLGLSSPGCTLPPPPAPRIRCMCLQ